MGRKHGRKPAPFPQTGKDAAPTRANLPEKAGHPPCWDDELESYRLSEITRVDFGGDYENALQLIGGSKYQRAVDLIWGLSNPRQAK